MDLMFDWVPECTAEQQRLSYDSGHRGNVFQARAFPSTGLAVVVTCAADGQVSMQSYQYPSCRSRPAASSRSMLNAGVLGLLV